MTQPTMTQDKILLLVDDEGMGSHLTRWLAAEKDEPYQCHSIPPGQRKLLLKATPYGEVPVLVHRGTSLYTPRVIAEYLQELMPLPALLPTDIAERNRQRQLFVDLLERVFPAIERCAREPREVNGSKGYKEIRQLLTASLSDWLTAGQLLEHNTLSLVDLAFGVILTRQHAFEFNLSRCHPQGVRYWEALKSRPAFTAGLSEQESDWLMVA